MRSAIMAIVAVLLSISTTFAQSEADKKAIRQIIESFHNDFNDGGFKKAEMYATEDWEHINPLGGIQKGRANVLKEVREVHQTFLKGVTMTLQDFTLRFITPDVGIVDTIDKTSDFTTPDGTKHENESHIKTYVLVKKNGKWLLTHDHNTIIR